MTESNEHHIYDVAGEVVEIDDDIELPDNWEDLSDDDYQALLDRLGIDSGEVEEAIAEIETMQLWQLLVVLTLASRLWLTASLVVVKQSWRIARVLLVTECVTKRTGTVFHSLLSTLVVGSMTLKV